MYCAKEALFVVAQPKNMLLVFVREPGPCTVTVAPFW